MRVALPALLFSRFAAGDTFDRVFLNDSKCIDGSPAAYYIKANPSSTKYILWLEGGGLCESLSDCKSRATGALGSSTGYGATQDPSVIRGMLSGSASANPDFAEWNRVFVPYCSGDVWEGQMTEATNPWSTTDPWKGYFSGHNIVAEIVGDLKASHGAAAASDFILTGCSAGGVGTFANCDFIGDAFPKAKVACRPEAGYFGLPIATFADFSQGRDSPDMMHKADSNWTKKVKPYPLDTPAVAACNKARNNGKDIQYCTDPDGCCTGIPYYYRYTKTPMFITQNTMDSYQVEDQGGATKSDATYIKYLHDILAGSLTTEVINGPKKGTDGLFGAGCLFHCPAPWGGALAPKVDGKNNRDTFGDWYFGRGTDHMHLDNTTDPKDYTSLSCSV